MKSLSVEYPIGDNALYELSKGFKLWLRKFFFISPIVREFTGYILDVGCRESLYLESYGGPSLGIDKSDYWISHSLQKGLNVLRADAESFVQENTFDTVLLSHILEHLDQPSKALENAYHNTKPTGKIIVTVPCWKGFLLNFNDWGGHKNFITEQDVDLCLVKFRGCKKLKASVFPPIAIPFLGRYRELRLIYQKGE